MKQAAFDEIRRIIREDEPQRPSQRISGSKTLLAIAAHRHIEPARLSRLVRGELDWIVMKALEKDRARRYETANSLAMDVERYLADEHVLACPPSRSYRFLKFARRNRGVLLAITAVTASLLIGLVASAWLAFRTLEAEGLAQSRFLKEREAVQAAEGARVTANDAKKEALSMRDEALTQAYRALLGETRALREARPAGWRSGAFDNLRQLAALDTTSRDFVELRSEAVASYGELDADEIERFVGHHSHLVYGLDFGPDGQTLASAGYDGRVFLWRLGQRRPATQLVDDAASHTGLWGSGAPLPVARIRPDGACLAYTTWSQKVSFLTLDEGLATPPEIVGQAPPRDLVFDRAGNRIAISWGNGHVGVYDASTGELVRMIDAATPQVGFYMRLALSPAGDLLACRGSGERIQLYRLNSDAAPQVVGSHGGLIRGLAFSSDGRFLGSASEDRTARIWAVRDGKEVLSLQGHTGKVISLAFSPDDELVATGSDDGTLRLWEARTGRLLLVLNPRVQGDGAPSGIQAVAFSPDGSKVAAASMGVVVY